MEAYDGVKKVKFIGESSVGQEHSKLTLEKRKRTNGMILEMKHEVN